MNRSKLLKTLAVLSVITLFAIGLGKFVMGGSATAPAKENGTNPQGTPDSSFSPNSETVGPDAVESSSPEDSSVPGTLVSRLTGASLNGSSQLEMRWTLEDAFYYEPLSDNLCGYITGVSYPALTEGDRKPEITLDMLRYVHILHYDFDGNPTEGELICNEVIAQDLVEIFYELYCNGYQLEHVLLIDEYGGDDTASMEDNNTSCFNYRVVAGTDILSEHSLGLAIDVNPFYNPYITYNEDGSENVSPAAATSYADRFASFPYKIDENDLCYKLFLQHGFTWGGDWDGNKDYQHFEKSVN